MDEDLMVVLDSWAKMVEMLTGMKRQLMDAGWSEISAEQVVIESFAQNGV